MRAPSPGVPPFSLVEERSGSRLVAAAEAAAHDNGDEGPHGLIVRQDELEDAPGLRASG